MPKTKVVKGVEEQVVVRGVEEEKRASWIKLQNRVLLEPFEYVCKIPGKKIRTKLIQVIRFRSAIDQKTLSLGPRLAIFTTRF